MYDANCGDANCDDQAIYFCGGGVDLGGGAGAGVLAERGDDRCGDGLLPEDGRRLRHGRGESRLLQGFDATGSWGGGGGAAFAG